MGTFIFLFLLFISVLFMFSLFTKSGKERIKDAAIVDVVEYTNNMDKLVKFLQSNYDRNNAKAIVSHDGDELIISVEEYNICDTFFKATNIVLNINDFTYEESIDADKFIRAMFKSGITVLNAQSIQEKKLFESAGVKKYTSKIHGAKLFSVDYETKETLYFLLDDVYNV